jgi:uncharacterized protein (TIGR03083 family)
MRLASEEYVRFLDLLQRLDRADWDQHTDCPAWDVKAMVGHVVGMAELNASLVEMGRQLRTAGKAPGPQVDALTALQVAKHAATPPDELVARFAQIAPKAADGRRRTPGFVRRRTMPQRQEIGGVQEAWTFGFLLDVILTRDVWMHRVDISRVTGKELELSAEHDGVLVADLVAEWAGRHGSPCTLTLTGAAGGTWSWGSGGPTLSYDAVEFCRGLSGRAEPALGTYVPF